MLTKLQVLFTVLSALCVAAVMPVGVWLGFAWAIGFILGAVLFFGLMLLCKQSAQANTPKENEQTDENDKKTE
ncbi:MAG: hypothetical protein IJX88_02560 [Clostridia bacterium]|nr:hypothetical protein [Clostridia bacterium]